MQFIKKYINKEMGIDFGLKINFLEVNYLILKILCLEMSFKEILIYKIFNNLSLKVSLI